MNLDYHMIFVEIQNFSRFGLFIGYRQKLTPSFSHLDLVFHLLCKDMQVIVMHRDTLCLDSQVCRVTCSHNFIFSMFHWLRTSSSFCWYTGARIKQIINKSPGKIKAFTGLFQSAFPISLYIFIDMIQDIAKFSDNAYLMIELLVITISDTGTETAVQPLEADKGAQVFPGQQLVLILYHESEWLSMHALRIYLTT